MFATEQVSSARIPTGLVLELFEHADWEGRSVKLDADTPFLPFLFDDMASSAKVRIVLVRTVTYIAVLS
jgi:hypothetical protein